MYYTYIFRCKDNSLSTGITPDLERRLKEHKEKGEKTAKYTLRHEVVKMEIAWKSENRVLASKLEFNIQNKNGVINQMNNCIDELRNINNIAYNTILPYDFYYKRALSY